MADTLILYEGKYGHSKKTAETLHEMLEGSVCCPAWEAPESMKEVKNLIVVFGFLAYDTGKHLKPYLKARQEEIKDKKIALVGVGLAKAALSPFLKIMEEPMERHADGGWFVMGGYKVSQLTTMDKEMLTAFWGEKGVTLKDQNHYKDSEVRKTDMEIKKLFNI